MRLFAFTLSLIGWAIHVIGLLLFPSAMVLKTAGARLPEGQYKPIYHILQNSVSKEISITYDGDIFYRWGAWRDHVRDFRGTTVRFIDIGYTNSFHLRETLFGFSQHWTEEITASGLQKEDRRAIHVNWSFLVFSGIALAAFPLIVTESRRSILWLYGKLFGWVWVILKPIVRRIGPNKAKGFEVLMPPK